LQCETKDKAHQQTKNRTTTTMSSSSTSQSGNPGYMMASQVDAEVARYRSLQESIQQQRSDLQILTSQSTENELVLLELKLVKNDESSSTVYKMVGPTLLKQDLEEAKETVQKRIEFIQVGNNILAAFPSDGSSIIFVSKLSSPPADIPYISFIHTHTTGGAKQTRGQHIRQGENCGRASTKDWQDAIDVAANDGGRGQRHCRATPRGLN
jgi:chaperonin cofactor prefoldin